MKRILISIITLVLVILIPCKGVSGDGTTEKVVKPMVICSRQAVKTTDEDVNITRYVDYDAYEIPWANVKITTDEFRLICITAACEGGCRWEYRDRLRLIAKTIINRYASGFGNSIHDVIYAEGQYNVTRWNGFPEAYADRVTDAVEVACYEAIATDLDAHDVYYFNSVGYFTWADDYWDDGVMFFSRGGK